MHNYPTQISNGNENRKRIKPKMISRISGKAFLLRQIKKHMVPEN